MSLTKLVALALLVSSALLTIAAADDQAFHYCKHNDVSLYAYASEDFQCPEGYSLSSMTPEEDHLAGARLVIGGSAPTGYCQRGNVWSFSGRNRICPTGFSILPVGSVLPVGIQPITLPLGTSTVPIIPVGTPTVVPLGSPQLVPLGSPTVVPLGSPTIVPLGSPTVVPLGAPQLVPLGSPTVIPLGSPTVVPLGTPQLVPLGVPSVVPIVF